MTPQAPGTVLDSDPLAQVGQLAGVADSVVRARSGVDALLRHKMLRRRSAEVTAEASLRSARASAALDGYDVPLDVLRRQLTTAVDAAVQTGAAAAQTRVMSETNEDETNEVVPADAVVPAEMVVPAETVVPAEALAAVRLYAELGTLTSAWERAPRQALARMHMLVARGLVPDEELGRPRQAGQRPHTDPVGLGTPPSPAQTQARLDGLTALLVSTTAAPAVVVAAVVHAELLALRPFGSFDGMVARAAGRLVLVSRGLDPKAVTSTDVGHLEAGTAAEGTMSTKGTTSTKSTTSGKGARRGAASVATATGGTATGGTATGGTATGGTATGGTATGEAVADYAAAARAYVTGGAAGVRTWITHYARAVELGARESLAVCEALDRTS